MSNSYDEIKKLLESSRTMTGQRHKLDQIKESLIQKNILTEQPMAGPGDMGATNTMGTPRTNVAADIEQEIDMDTTPKEQKQQAYRISGGILVMHGTTKGDFVDEVSDMVDFYPLNFYPTSVEWSGKVIDQDLEFYYAIGENNGVYVNGTMIRVDDEFLDFITKLRTYYKKFKTKWAKVLASRKKTQTGNNE